MIWTKFLKKSTLAVRATSERTSCRRRQISLLSKIANISRKTYYTHLEPTPAERRRAETVGVMRDLQEKEGFTLGIESMQLGLRVRGIRLSHNTVARLMRENKLCCVIRGRKFPPAYYRAVRELKMNLPKNLLDREFDSRIPGKYYVTDITYLPVRGGWKYLSVIKDLYNKEIVAWAMSSSASADLCIKTLEILAKKRNLNGAMIHSDMGATYTSKAYRSKLQELGMVQSMSRKGDCYDNASAESFFAVYKTCCFGKDKRKLELHQFCWADVFFRTEAWIEKYNTRRPQLGLEGLSPVYYRILYPNGRLTALPDNRALETA